MNKRTIKKLAKLNQDFYEHTADEFSDSRNYFWQGWEKCLVTIKRLAKQKKQTPLTVLDLGCGNGRFAQFLHQKLEDNFKYWGVDNSDKLLKKSIEINKDIKPSVQLIKLDLVTELLNNDLAVALPNIKFDLVVMFGVLHHIPSLSLRKRLLAEIARILQSKGVLIFTAWQFGSDPRFKRKIVGSEEVGIKSNELEPGDYILDWQRGPSAYRYCHFAHEKEIKELIIKTNNYWIVDDFQADSKSGKLNNYYILKKKT